MRTSAFVFAALLIVGTARVAAAQPCSGYTAWQGGDAMFGIGVAVADQGYLVTWNQGYREHYATFDTEMAPVGAGDREPGETSWNGRTWWRLIGGADDFLRLEDHRPGVLTDFVDMSGQVTRSVLIADDEVGNLGAGFDGSAYIVLWTTLGDERAIHVARVTRETDAPVQPLHVIALPERNRGNLRAKRIGDVTWVVWAHGPDLASATTVGVRLAVDDGRLLDDEPVVIGEGHLLGLLTTGDEGTVFLPDGERVVLDRNGVVTRASDIPVWSYYMTGGPVGYATYEPGQYRSFGEEYPLQATLMGTDMSVRAPFEIVAMELAIAADDDRFVVVTIEDEIVSPERAERSLFMRVLSDRGVLTAPFPSPVAQLTLERRWWSNCTEPTSSVPADAFAGCSVSSGRGSTPVGLAVLALWWIARRHRSRSRSGRVRR